jgi:hypothetical protein
MISLARNPHPILASSLRRSKWSGIESAADEK